jgi:hypothetical protein
MLPHSTTPRLPGITLFSATYCTDFPKCYSVPSCYTKALADYSTETVEYYSKAAKYFSAPIYTTITEAAKEDAVPTCYTKAALSCYVEHKYYTNAPVHYTTTYATHATRPQVLHRRSCLLHDSVCCLVNYTEAPKYYITKALEFYTSMYADPTYYTEAPHYYNPEALKYYTIQPTLPRATTPTSRSITVRKRSLEKRSCVRTAVCHQLHSSSCNQFTIMGKYSYFYIEFCINTTFFYLCVLIFNINVNLFNV